jgi:hypothetical protein
MLLNEFERVVDSRSLRIDEVIQAGPPWNSRVTQLEFQLLLYHQNIWWHCCNRNGGWETGCLGLGR